MAADFWAGYISGAIGILIGNPLDLIKVRLQAGTLNASTLPRPISPLTSQTVIHTNTVVVAPSSTFPAISSSAARSLFPDISTLLRGSAAPILGYGALNALLFMTYNRTSSYLTHGTLTPPSPLTKEPIIQPNLTTTFIAGALGGLATWIVSTPTELVKCRAQVLSNTSTSASHSPNSYTIFKDILRSHGVKGLYAGGVVTALRDSIGYGFYFWFYEASTRFLTSHYRPFSFSSSEPQQSENRGTTRTEEALKVLLCGGLAGVVTWASVFPLDVIKTRVQTQTNLFSHAHETVPLLGAMQRDGVKPMGAMEVARRAYTAEGMGVFFRGLGVCSIRAFIVNAVQWAVYEGVMNELVAGRKKSG